MVTGDRLIQVQHVKKYYNHGAIKALDDVSVDINKGDVMVVIDGLIRVLTTELQAGNSVQMGEFGNFRLSVGSSGVANAEDFNTSLFKKGKIIFTPGSRLRTMSASPKFERIELKPAE